MKDHLRFSVVYWHTFRGTGADPFGPGTAVRPWEDGTDSVENAQKRARVAFEFIEKLGAPFYASTTATSPPKARTLAETNKNLDAVVKVLKEEQQRTGIKLLWGTANLFSNPRYMHGAATSRNADVFAYAAAQVKKALEVTKELGGEGYTFWGGREGYQNLWNTDMKRELDHLGRVPAHGGRLREGDRLQGPVLHRAEAEGADQAPVRLRRGGLPQLPAAVRPAAALQAEPRDEPRHARRPHDAARAGSRRRRRASSARSTPTRATCCSAGTPTSSRPTSISPRSACCAILKYGGFTTGGVNFDAKVRRESFEPIDLFHAHIGGMDAFARGLKIAAAMRADGKLEGLLKERYASWDSGLGAEIEAGKHTLASLEKIMLEKGEQRQPQRPAGDDRESDQHVPLGRQMLRQHATLGLAHPALMTNSRVANHSLSCPPASYNSASLRVDIAGRGIDEAVFGDCRIDATCAPVAHAAEVFPVAKSGRGEVRYIDSLPVAILIGSPEEIGKQHGELLTRPSAELMEFPRRVLAESGLGFFYPLAAQAGKTLILNAPQRYQQEIAAATEAGKLEPETLAVANTLLELRRVGCSALIVEPKRSATGAPLFGRNFDFPPFGLLDRFGLVTVVRPTGRHAFAAVGFPGMMGVLSGMNDAGLCVATLDVYETADGSPSFDATGVPMALAFRQLLEECTTIAEAESLLKHTKATTYANLAVCDRDHGAVFEITPKQVVRRDAEDALLPCTNHFRSPSLAVNQQCWRYDRLESTRRDESVDVSEIQSALHQANQGETTLQTMVFEPRELVLHLSMGAPPSSGHKLQRLELAKLLTAPPTSNSTQIRLGLPKRRLASVFFLSGSLSRVRSLKHGHANTVTKSAFKHDCDPRRDAHSSPQLDVWRRYRGPQVRVDRASGQETKESGPIVTQIRRRHCGGKEEHCRCRRDDSLRSPE